MARSIVPNRIRTSTSNERGAAGGFQPYEVRKIAPDYFGLKMQSPARDAIKAGLG
jgi:hypothetical protein